MELPHGGENLTTDDVANTLMKNRVPIEWAEHAYLFGLYYLDYHFSSNIMSAISESVDNERLKRLEQFGVPPALPDWNGWWTPKSDDWDRMHVLIFLEERKTPPLRSLEDPHWLLAGEPELFQQLHARARLGSSSIASIENAPPEVQMSTAAPAEMPLPEVSNLIQSNLAVDASSSSTSGFNNSLGMSELSASLSTPSEDIDMDSSPLTTLTSSPEPTIEPGETPAA